MVWPFSSSKPQASAESSQDSSNEPVLILQEPQTVESSEARERRRYMLVDAVRENCAFDAAAFMDCQKSWSLWNRGTLCQAAQFKFTDCMNVQRELLIQLGYGREGNTERDDELIKWHADELYQKRRRDRAGRESLNKPSEQSGETKL